MTLFERVRLLGAVDHERVDAAEVVGPAVPEHRQLAALADRSRVPTNDKPLGALILRSPAPAASDTSTSTEIPSPSAIA